MFWLVLPYLIAGFVRAVRKAPDLKNKSAMTIGKDIAKIARSVINDSASPS